MTTPLKITPVKYKGYVPYNSWDGPHNIRSAFKELTGYDQLNFSHWKFAIIAIEVCDPLPEDGKWREEYERQKAFWMTGDYESARKEDDEYILAMLCEAGYLEAGEYLVDNDR